MAWCLVKSESDKFKRALVSGEINPAKLADMTSEERRAEFQKYVTEENAKNINALFESKLLLKNQQRGMITWAKRVTGIKKEVRRDIIAKIERIQEVLDPQEGEQFLKDLASQRLRVDVTQEEAKAIADMSKKLQDLRANIQEDSTFATEEKRLEYGRAKIALANYVNALKLEAGKKTLKEQLKTPVKAVSSVAGNSKAIRASMDNSAIFRQGWKAMWTHPKLWKKNATKTFKDIWKTFGKDEVMDELNADLVSRPNALNNYYKKAKLALGTIEEEFPGSFAERVPGIKKFYKASENAFTAFVYKTRADIFDAYIKVAEAQGVDLNENELRSIGKMVNSLTGRGDIGVLEPAGNVINNVFWSPRKLKADIDLLTVHALDKNYSKFARKESAKNTLKVVMGTAMILALANAWDDDAVEEDPRSANFGKIKIGNTRFDVTAGMGSIVTLASRLLTLSTKSSTTGKVTRLNTGEYGGMTGKDVIYDFFENKLAPVSSVIMDLLEGQDFNGNKITALSVLKDLFIPLPATNISETLQEPDHANILAVILADAFGIGTNTYSPQSNWKNSTSKTLTQFREVVGDKKFEEANKKFNKRYNDFVKNTINTEEYKSLSDEAKQQLISDGKTKIQDAVLKEYGFKYSKTQKTQEQKQDKKIMDSFLKKLQSFNLKNPFDIQVYAKDGEAKVKLPSLKDRRRYFNVANDLKKEHPEWYAENVGEEGELNMFGHTITNWDKFPPATSKNVIKHIDKISETTPDDGKESVKANAPIIGKSLEDQGIYSDEVMAYALATIQHETQNSMSPIIEGYFNDLKYGYEIGFTGRSQAKKRGYDGGENYYGRGYIQLTHKENYKRYGDLLGLDLENNPDLAIDPQVASDVLAVYFKNRGIDKLIEEGKIVEARRKINPDNKGKMIEETYQKYLSAFRGS